MKPEQLLEAQVRAAAMQATVALFCCQADCQRGSTDTGPAGEFDPEQFQRVLDQLYEASKQLTAKILTDVAESAS